MSRARDAQERPRGRAALGKGCAETAAKLPFGSASFRGHRRGQPGQGCGRGGDSDSTQHLPAAGPPATRRAPRSRGLRALPRPAPRPRGAGLGFTAREGCVRSRGALGVEDWRACRWGGDVPATGGQAPGGAGQRVVGGRGHGPGAPSAARSREAGAHRSVQQCALNVFSDARRPITRLPELWPAFVSALDLRDCRCHCRWDNGIKSLRRTDLCGALHSPRHLPGLHENHRRLDE